ncbi:hypothetical protein E3Q23_00680 [Wallemia mellicola]|nr:hypothetical protein E3Q23_00680 [Wallemia mellicola]TIC30632.1 hypothetical protein E3Q11_00851 [Wallemia mellicola]
MDTQPFREPAGGSSLFLGFNSRKKTLIVIGQNRLAASRVYTALDADTSVVVIGNALEHATEEIQHRVAKQQIVYIAATTEEDIKNAIKSTLGTSITFATITDSTLDDVRSVHSVESLVETCRSLNIPLNVADRPEFCDYIFPTSHRFTKKDGSPSPLQIAVTTNSKGCRLASRIKRELISHLPSNIGDAVSNVGQLRSRAKHYLSRMKLERTTSQSSLSEELADFDNVNAAVPQLGKNAEDAPEKALRRMRWVAQISEYWPLEYLANMDEAAIDSLLDAYGEPNQPSTPTNEIESKEWPVLQSPSEKHAFGSTSSRGHIVLVGAGLGSPELLTIAAYRALKTADLVLSDKLVPSAVLKLIPRTTEVRIARKFPGNAEGAQAELMNWAVEGAQAGKVVVRLKQGDPFVYGRGGEEVVHFRQHGYEAVVVPGISSAMSAPLMAGIPVTQRGASDSYLLCTGVGRGGKALSVPAYVRSRTLVILMGVARLAELVSSLGTLGYPSNVPVAIIEQASSPSQRVVMSTLKDIVSSYNMAGEQRPPGMIVVGWTILSLQGSTGDMSVLDDGGEQHDEERVQKWLNGRLSIVSEGCEVPASGEVSAVTAVPGLIPPTPALSTASSPQPSIREGGPSTPAPEPAAAVIIQDSPLTAALTNLIELAKQENWQALSLSALEAETMFAQVDPDDKLWEAIYNLSILSDLLLDNLPAAQATLNRSTAIVKDRLGVSISYYFNQQYKDALQALTQLATQPQTLVNDAITSVFNHILSLYQTKVLMRALNVVALSCSAVQVVKVSESIGVPHNKLVDSTLLLYHLVMWFTNILTVLKNLGWSFSEDGSVVYPLTSSSTQNLEKPTLQNIASSVYLLETS